MDDTYQIGVKNCDVAFERKAKDCMACSTPMICLIIAVEVSH